MPPGWLCHARVEKLSFGLLGMEAIFVSVSLGRGSSFGLDKIWGCGMDGILGAVVPKNPPSTKSWEVN